MKKPEIVCLCGSTKFKEQFIAEARRLTLEGYIVLTCHVFGHVEDFDMESEAKVELDKLHLFKIGMAHRVHIINFGSYIGDGTLAELKFAKDLGKKITYMCEIGVSTIEEMLNEMDNPV